MDRRLSRLSAFVYVDNIEGHVILKDNADTGIVFYFSLMLHV